MNSDDVLLIVSITAVVMSIVMMGITYNSISNSRNVLTGLAIEPGYVNVTIASSASINISSAAGVLGNSTINWGSGIVNQSAVHATLTTVGSGNVTNGTWNVKGNGFIIDNIGNVNVTLGIKSNSTAATLLGGTSPSFQYNISDSLAGSCSDYVTGFENTWKDFTTSNVEVCNNFSKVSGTDQLRLDIKLIIPIDANYGNKNAVITLTYSEI